MKTSEIDFKNPTLRDLRKMLPSTSDVPAPSENWFRLNPNQVLCTDSCQEYTITVYANGFYTYTEDRGKHLAVLRVDGFKRIRYHFADKSMSFIEEKDFLDEPYAMSLYMNGQNQWEKNYQGRNNYYHDVYPTNDGNDWNEALAVPSAEDHLLQKEQQHELRELLKPAMSQLTKRQREVLVLHIVEGMPQEMVANTIGLSRCTVQTHLDRAKAKIRNYFGIDVIKNPLFFSA